VNYSYYKSNLLLTFNIIFFYQKILKKVNYYLLEYFAIMFKSNRKRIKKNNEKFKI